MSIKDHQDEDIVRLPGIWEVVMKAAALAAIASCGLGFTWGTWVTVKTFQHDSEIALLQERIHSRGGGSQTTSVNVGATDSVAEEIDAAAKHRGYYLTSEAAKILKKSERSITSMCAAGMIPDAVQPEGGRGWHIPLGFLLGVGTDENFSGKQPLAAANSGNDTEPNRTEPP